MHIVHLTPNFYPAVGGIETYVYELAKRMVKKGHKVSVVTSNKLNDGKVLKKFERIAGIDVYRVPFKLIMRYNFSPNAFRLLINLNYDVLHVHSIGYFTDIIPHLKKRTWKKIIVSTHGGIFHTKHMTLLKKIYFKSLAKSALKSADRVIATSIKDFKLFSPICDRRKIIMIHPGVDYKMLSKLKPAKIKNTLLFVGRLAENKKLERLVYVVDELKKELNDVKLLVVGRDWGEKGRLISLVKKLGLNGNVKFFTDVKDHYKYFSKANVFVLSSEYEGFGISVLEAMAAGLPVVVNDIETMREIVENNKNGYLVDFNDYQGAAQVLLNLLKDEKLGDHLGKNGRDIARKFDWDIISPEVERLYRN